MKETTVLITNHTPLQITILGHVIGARAVNQQVQLINVQRFAHELKCSYPNGELSIVLPSESVDVEQDPSVQATSIKALDLSASVEKALAKEGITTVEQLTEKTAVEVVAVKGIAEATLSEIEEKLKAMGLTLKEKGDE